MKKENVWGFVCGAASMIILALFANDIEQRVCDKQGFATEYCKCSVVTGLLKNKTKGVN